jgi:hypothetical protein
MTGTCTNGKCETACAGDTWPCDGKCVGADEQCHGGCNPVNRTTCRFGCLPKGAACPDPVALTDYTLDFPGTDANGVPFVQTDHGLIGTSDISVLPIDQFADPKMWKRGAVLGHAEPVPIPGKTVPLLLFYNPDPLTVDAFTTTDTNPGGGYQRKSSGEAHIYKNPEPGTRPLKVFFSSFSNDHFTTTDNPGGDYKQAGGIIGYVLP